MRQGKSAHRYAKSLVSLAKEQKLLEAVRQDAELISKTISDNKELGLVLQSPVVKSDKKQEIFKAIFGGKVNELSISFFNLLANNGRENIADLAFNEVIALYRAENKIVKADIVSAVQLSKDTLEKLEAKIQKTGSTLEINSKVNPDLIGGFIVRIEDEQIDASISTALNKLKLELQA